MKDIGEGTIRRIDWTELTPVVLLLRVINVALGVRVLMIAMVGLLLTTLLAPLLDAPFTINLPSVPEYTTPIAMGRTVLSVPELYLPLFVGHSVWEHPQRLLWLLGFVLTWAFCGGMICRIVAMRLTVDESESTGNLLLFLRKRSTSFLSSLVILSLGILISYAPVQIAYWLAGFPGLNYVVAILFPVPLLFAFIAVILALGFAVGWMLLFAAVSTDGSDGFDAISRMFSYISQRPLHYLFYWSCCGFLGWLGLWLVSMISAHVIHMFRDIVFPSYFADIGANDIAGFWMWIVQILPVAYMFAWFWTSSIAIYLLLRRSVDATPFNEVYRVVPPKVRTLPTIKKDERGAPQADADSG